VVILSIPIRPPGDVEITTNPQNVAIAGGALRVLPTVDTDTAQVVVEARARAARPPKQLQSPVSLAWRLTRLRSGGTGRRLRRNDKVSQP
jgi:hypothetical protein